jgi:indole-3-glycerol phosphate synthase
VTTYLDRILDAHRRRVRDDARSLDALIDDCQSCPPTRSFARAIRAQESPPGPDLVAVVAEIKRRSPSKGDLLAALDPAALARQYEVGGAACLSVLTDAEFFGGSPSDLQAARGAVALPALRKDFMVSPQDVVDTRLMGADAVLLIVAALSDSELGDFHTLAIELGLDALVEVHDEAELERAIAAGATMIGVNQRDLVTFEVDTDRAVRVAQSFPPGVVKVAESGIVGAEDAAMLAEAGYDAVLVGEALVTSGDAAAAVRSLRRPDL